MLVPSFSIGVGGRALFKDCPLRLAHGRRYGLVGPNGCGKSTLLAAIAASGAGDTQHPLYNEQIAKGLPKGLAAAKGSHTAGADVLLVEQEVQASEKVTALQMVVAADTRRAALLEEVATLEKQLDEGGLKYCAADKLEPADAALGLAVGASCTYFRSEYARKEGLGVAATVVAEPDGDGDYTIQTPFDVDGALAAKLGNAHAELDAIGADRAEARASAILTGLQFREEQKGWPTARFSGGWRMRLSLARALFVRPRLLLLDEPTNHLDLHAVIWLTGYLQGWRHSLVVVSHDRDFLSTVTTDTLHCWQRKLVPYRGGYDVFEAQFEKTLASYQDEYARQQRTLKALKHAGKTKTRDGADGGGGGGGGGSGGGAAAARRELSVAVVGKGGKAQARSRQLASFGGSGEGGEGGEGASLLEPIKHKWMRIGFAVGHELRDHPHISLNDVSFRFGGGEGGEGEGGGDGKSGGAEAAPSVLSDVSLGLSTSSRIALVGANGAGKTTLLRLMRGQLEPTAGEVRLARSCRVGVYSQHACEHLAWPEGYQGSQGRVLHPVSYLRAHYPDKSYQEARNALGRFGLDGAHHEQPIDTLSGGQRARVVMVGLSFLRPHVLLLDEPTNHLDLESVDALVEGLRAYQGGVLVTTHNLDLISKVCDEIWLVEGGGVKPFGGDIDEYRDGLAERLAKVYEDDVEEEQRQRGLARKQKEKDALQDVGATAANAGGEAAGGGAKGRPKSKAERAALRAEARAAAEAKQAAAATARGRP